MIIQTIQNGVSYILPFIVLLGLLIFVHELGHYLVAVWCGVRVETFSLGFGKKIFQYKRGDTNYCLSIIPLGGYVKMFGDEVGGDIPEDQKKYSFTHKAVWQRIAVVLAGPLMNFFFAILIFFIVSVAGEEMRAPVVGDLPTDSVAFKDGFRAGDQILSLDNQPIQSWDEFQNLISENYDKKVNVLVKREGTDQNVSLSSIPKLKANPNVLSLQDYEIGRAHV